jgi:adenylate kinase
MIIVLFGKPGAGKGTQAPLLAAALGVPTLSTGDELRAAIRAGTTLGREAKGFMDAGELVPDAVIMGIIKQALSEPRNANGVLLDGVVRTVPQAEGLAKVCEELGKEVAAVLCFDIDDEEIVRRLSGRTVCEICQSPYTGREPGTPCDKNDGGKLVRRKDDEPDAIRNRLQVYERQTAPVLKWYREHGTKVAVIDAVGSVQEVTSRALGVLASDVR